MAKKKKKKDEDFISMMVNGPKETPAIETEVIIEKAVYQKIMFWVNKSDCEVSGLGKVIIEDGVLRVVDAILLPQVNTETATDIDAKDFGKAMFELKDTPGALNWWWHSHVDMDVFFSGTDKNTIRKLGAGGWFLNTVFNKRKQFQTSLYLKQPIELFFDKIATTIEEFADPKLEEAWEKEYKAKVKNKPMMGSHSFFYTKTASGKDVRKEKEEEIHVTGEDEGDDIELDEEDLHQLIQERMMGRRGRRDVDHY